MACYVNPVPTFNLTQHLSPTEFRPAKATPLATVIRQRVRRAWSYTVSIILEISRPLVL